MQDGDTKIKDIKLKHKKVHWSNRASKLFAKNKE